MALSKIKLANKKSKRSQKRKIVQVKIRRKRDESKIRTKRAREVFLQGRREHQAKRQANKTYLETLEEEIQSEQ
jgi:hypothetical protein